MLTSVTTQSPFKFLDAYTAQDKALFFGRETEQKRLVELLFRSRLILVYGPSGTGKTSLVQCGLAKALTPTDYFPVLVRRRGNLLRSLQTTLTTLLGEADTPDVVELVQRLSRYAMRPVYLIFDQFEELFISGTPDEQTAFLTQLNALYAAPVACKLLLVLREDYLASLYPFEAALPGLFDFRLRVEPMSERNLEQVVVETCRSVGIRLDDEAETLRRILQSNRDARNAFQLPYLQVYLDRLWRTARESTPEGEAVAFSPALVERVGDLDDVLERFLNEQKKSIADALPPDDRPAVGRVLEAFVTYEGTRREHHFASLQTATGLPPELLRTILADLERTRLLRHEDDTYELPHDSLAKVIDQGRSAGQRQVADILRRLKDDYRYFLEKNGADDVLLSPRRVSEIMLLEKAVHDELRRSLPDAEGAWQFVVASQQFNERQHRRQINRLRRTVAVVLGLLALAVVAMILAVNQWRDSNVKSVVFQTREMDPLSALVMTAWAYGEDRGAVTENALFNVFYNQQPYETALDPDSRVEEAAFSGDGRFLLTSTKDNHLHVWDSTGHRLLDSLDVGNPLAQWVASRDFSNILFISWVGNDNRANLWHRPASRALPLSLSEPVNEVGLSPDGQTIVCTTETQLVWFDGGGQRRESLARRVEGLRFSPDGRHLAFLGENGTAYVADTRTRRLVDSLSLKNRPVGFADFFGNGDELIVVAGEGLLLRWERSRRRTVKLSFPVKAVTLAASGAALLVDLGDERVTLDRHFTALDTLGNDQVPIVDDFSADGRAVLGSLGGQKEVQIRAPNGTVLSRFPHNSEVNHGQFSPDGHRVVTVTFDGRAFVWNRRDPRSVGLPHAADVRLFTFSPDGQTVVTAADQRLFYWNTRGERLDSLTFPAAVNACLVAPDGRRVFVHTDDGRAWVRQGNQSARLLPVAGVQRVAISPKGTFVLAFTQTGTFALTPDGSRKLSVWPSVSPAVRLPFNRAVPPVDFSPDGQTVLFVTDADSAYRWRYGDRQARRIVTPKPVLEARFSPDGQRLLVATIDGGLSLLTPDGKPTGTKFPPMSLGSLLFAADGKDVLAEDVSLVGYLGNLTTQRLRALPQRGAVYWKRFSPDGRQILLGTGAGLYLSNRQGEPLLATSTWYSFGDFSPDNTRLGTQLGHLVLLWPSPDNLVPWLHQTYDDRTLAQIHDRAKTQYGIHTSFGEELWHRLKTALNR
jgi:WD40 repeat protein